VTDWLQRIADKLALLRKNEAALLLEYAELHHYELLATIAEREVRSLEGRYGIQLPADYRLFITELGNGGAGPGSGLQIFGWAPDWHEMCEADWPFFKRQGAWDGPEPWDFRNGMWWHARHADRVAKPFPVAETVDDLRLSREQLQGWDDWYAPFWHDGHIMLSLYGIVGRGDPAAILIVEGSSVGTVWIQHLGYSVGICRFADFRSVEVHKPWPGIQTDYTFAMWYECWLDDCLKQVDQPKS
jgi:hypothetical protein